ncbi:MAG: ABC transporter permease [Planctomycetes bacterium]|nr:ABC transporter permease [Planctomycetota bacterium]
MTSIRQPTRGGGLARGLADFREFMIIALILAIAAAMSLASPVFLTPENLSVVLLAVSTQAIVAVGMTVLLVSGGFDLSVGSTVGLAGAVTAMGLAGGLPVAAAVLAGLALGAAIGAANGLIVARIGINPFITTLGMMGIVRGALEVISRGKNISGLPKAFNEIGQGYLADIQHPIAQHPIVISLVLVALGDILLRQTRFFRQNYYIGGNEKAARLTGINVDRITIFNYALTGLLAAVAGIIMTARLGSATVTAGAGLELQVISAVIIGGASLQGGEGTVLGSFLGCILMALIVTSLNLLGVDIYWQRLIIGATLLAAVMIDTLGKRRHRR